MLYDVQELHVQQVPIGSRIWTVWYKNTNIGQVVADNEDQAWDKAHFLATDYAMGNM